MWGSLTLAPIDNIFPVIVVITQALTHFLLFFRITVLFDPKNKKNQQLKVKNTFRLVPVLVLLLEVNHCHFDIDLWGNSLLNLCTASS